MSLQNRLENHTPAGAHALPGSCCATRLPQTCYDANIGTDSIRSAPAMESMLILTVATAFYSGVHMLTWKLRFSVMRPRTALQMQQLRWQGFATWCVDGRVSTAQVVARSFAAATQQRQPGDDITSYTFNLSDKIHVCRWHQFPALSVLNIDWCRLRFTRYYSGLKQTATEPRVVPLSTPRMLCCCV